jgi:hypothetical protein
MPLPFDLRYAAVLRREMVAREARLYGPLLDAVILLRRRGFGVHVEGKRFRVGNRLMGARELSATAARERRLLNAKPGDT